MSEETTYPFELNDGQQDALHAMKEWWDKGESKVFGLYGYAGTGKTSCLQRLVGMIEANVVMAAPTHKAVGILRSMSVDYPGKPAFSTIHSLLSLKLKTNDDREEFVPDPYKIPPIYDYDLVICDECSMINDELWGFILQAVNSVGGPRLIVMGDPLQLPPVGYHHSQTFDVPDSRTLSEVMRFAGELGFLVDAVRDSIGSPKIIRPRAVKDSYGEIIIMPDKDEWLYSLHKDVEIGKDIKALSFTNASVDSTNSFIRRRLLGRDAPPFIPGELLVAVQTYASKNEIYAYTEDECRILEAYETHDWDVDCWRIVCMNIHTGEQFTALAVTPQQQEALDRELRQLASDKNWKKYWPMKNAFAKLRPPYATTIHKCLPHDAPVHTVNRGLIPISDCHVGELVWTGNGRQREITGKWSTGERPIVSITTKTGSELRCTPEHRVLTQRGWVEAQDLSHEDFLVSPRIDEPIPHDHDDAWMMGLLVGDGCYSYDSNRIDLTIDSRNVSVIERVERVWSGYNVRRHPKHDSNAITLSIEDKAYRDYLLYRGIKRVTRNDKTAPNLQTRAEKRSFIQGLMDADGSASKNGRMVRLVNVSRRLLLTVKSLLVEFGIISYISGVETPQGSRPAYCLHISGEDVDLYADRIGFTDSGKSERLANRHIAMPKSSMDFIPSGSVIKQEVLSLLRESGGVRLKGMDSAKSVLGRMEARLTWGNLETLAQALRERDIEIPTSMTHLLERRVFFDQVSFIEQVGMSPCFDIEVDEDHSFLTEGLVVHNSQGSTFGTVFVNNKDLFLSCRSDDVLRQKLQYVAYSRASKALVIHS